MSADYILHLIRTEQPISALPFRPKGGETWIFKGDGLKAQDWRADGHHWINQGTVGLPRKNPRLKKKYFYINTENGASKEFVRFVYHEPNSPDGPFVIQYIGNEQISQPLSHGNSKNQERPFIRSKPSSLEKWLSQTKSEDPNLVYKKEIHDEEDQPRDLKQIQNLRHKGNTELRISRDALYNLHALARDTSNQFIQVINTFPSLIVICGHKLMFEELERVLYLDNESQCLSYDTTFQLGDFYVSTLIFRHILFKEMPCMPALFMLHERKFQKHHELLFQFFKDNIRLPKTLLACVTDGEQGIMNALSCVPTLVDVRCWNHILNDIGRWVTEHGFSNAEVTAYKDHMRFIFGRDSREESISAYEELNKAWDETFKTYFIERILPQLGKVSKWAIEKITRYDPYSGITQNQSESMNKVLKQLNKWKEAPADVVVLSFLRLHQFYLKEISRGRAGIGTYTLKPQYISAKIDLSEIIQFTVSKPEDIVNGIRENQFLATSEENDTTRDIPSQKIDINISRADELIKNDRIAFAPKLGTFTILGQDDKARVVTIFPESCSCGSLHCYHLIAVKKSLGMNIDSKSKPNLTTLRGLDEKKKAGRKRPRHGDFDYEISPDKSSRILEKPVTVQLSRKTDTAVTEQDEKPVTIQSSRKTESAVTTQRDEETSYTIYVEQDIEPGEPMESNTSVSGPDWVRVESLILKDEEKNILYSPSEWLNDRIIDAAMLLLKRQFPHIWGLDSCLNAATLTFPRAFGNFIQIVNRTPEHGGSHWLTLSSMKVKNKSEIKIYDSGFTSLSFPVQQIVCNLLKKDTPPKKNDRVLLNFMDCAFQENGNDCGLYAIANATAEANGLDPCTQRYDVELLRGHLIQCLDKGKMTPFPAGTRSLEHPNGVRYTAYLKVFCSCRMPEDGLYVVCNKCKIWYHPECEGLKADDIPGDDIPYFCKKCTQPKKRNTRRK